MAQQEDVLVAEGILVEEILTMKIVVVAPEIFGWKRGHFGGGGEFGQRSQFGSRTRDFV